MSIAEKFEIIADAVYEKGISDRDELIYNVVTDNERRINYHNAFVLLCPSLYFFFVVIRVLKSKQHLVGG